MQEQQIAFEVCPTSNHQSGVVSDITQHPLPKIIESGLLSTVNTDDPGISQIDLSNEYQVCIQQLGIPLTGLKALILNAAKTSFLPNSEKEVLVTKTAAELEAHIPG